MPWTGGGVKGGRGGPANTEANPLTAAATSVATRRNAPHRGKAKKEKKKQLQQQQKPTRDVLTSPLLTPHVGTIVIR